MGFLFGESHSLDFVDWQIKLFESFDVLDTNAFANWDFNESWMMYLESRENVSKSTRSLNLRSNDRT